MSKLTNICFWGLGIFVLTAVMAVGVHGQAADRPEPASVSAVPVTVAPLPEPVIRGTSEQTPVSPNDGPASARAVVRALPIDSQAFPSGEENGNAGGGAPGGGPRDGDPRAPLGTSWTYQGQLKLSGVPVTGLYDMQFTLLDDFLATVAGPLCMNNVSVAAGLFTVELDFSPATPFSSSENRYLKIEVVSDSSGTSACGSAAFTALNPAQKLTAAPYALGLHLPYRGSASLPSDELVSLTNLSDRYALTAFSPGPLRPALFAGTGSLLAFYPGSGLAASTDQNFGISGLGPTTGVGVLGTTSTGISYFPNSGVFGFSEGGIGVGAKSPSGDGMVSLSSGANKSGIYAVNDAATGTTYGVFGAVSSPAGYAGYFDGRGYFSGNVGIGTTSPSEVLDVSSNSTFKTGIHLQNSSVAQNYVLQVTGSDPGNAGRQGNLEIWRAGTPWGIGLVMQPDGDVGIGTTSPTSKLHVCGNIRAVGNITASGTITASVAGACPDFVFDDDYALMTPDELREYVACHKHLPHMRSGAQIEQDGLDLGASQMSLLQTAEELTLYMLDQHKALQTQQSQMEQQRSQVERLSAANALKDAHITDLAARLDRVERMLSATQAEKGAAR